MKYPLSTTKGISLFLLSLALMYGCNVNDSVPEGKNVKVMLRGKVFNGETGQEVPNAVITIYESVRTGEDLSDFRDFKRATATTDHYGNYYMDGIMRSCTMDETGGSIEAVKIDSTGRYRTYTGQFKCSERLQTRNLILRRPTSFLNLIIK